MTLHSESFAYSEADLYDLGFLSSIAFSAASRGFKPFSINRVLWNFVSDWNTNIWWNSGLTLLSLGNNLLFNATILSPPDFEYELTEEDQFIHIEMNGTISVNGEQLYLGPDLVSDIDEVTEQAMYSGNSWLYASQDCLLSYFWAWAVEDTLEYEIEFPAWTFLRIMG